MTVLEMASKSLHPCQFTRCAAMAFDCSQVRLSHVKIVRRTHWIKVGRGKKKCSLNLRLLSNDFFRAADGRLQRVLIRSGRCGGCGLLA